MLYLKSFSFKISSKSFLFNFGLCITSSLTIFKSFTIFLNWSSVSSGDFKIFDETIEQPFNVLLFEWAYRWEVDGFEMIGVTPQYYDATVSCLPVRKRVYKELETGHILYGDTIRFTHEMYNHPNEIVIWWKEYLSFLMTTICSV